MIALFLTVLPSPSDADKPLQLIAHRGGVVDEQTIENNLSSINEAIRRGYWMVEADIRRSRDGVPVVHHDRTFQRYYGDPRRVSELDWQEIARLRATPGGERPLKLSEYAAACQGRLQIMLDVKAADDGEDHPREYLESIERALAEHDLLENAYLIGTDQSKQFFRDKIRLGANPQVLFAAAERGEPVAERYFLFDRGSRVTEEIVDRTRQLNVPIVAAINRIRYPDDEAMALALAKADIARLLALDVNKYQIDSQYDVWFPNPAD